MSSRQELPTSVDSPSEESWERVLRTVERDRTGMLINNSWEQEGTGGRGRGEGREDRSEEEVGR